MKAATTQGFGKRSRLVIVDKPQPDIGPDDVLVEVHASSVNPKDWKLNQSISSLIPSLGWLPRPFIIGDDLAGVVVAKGDNVKNLAIGDAVYGMDMNYRTAACAEFARISAGRIAKKPLSLSFKQAAASPLAGLTALQGLQIGKAGKGTRVLIIGASGGVGTFAVQIAKAMGACVTGVCSGRNAALVSDIGADEVIDYTQENFKQRQDEFDLVFDVTSFHSYASCSGLMKADGIFVSTGGNAKAVASSLRDRWLRKQKQSRNVWVNSNTKDLEKLAEYLDQGQVKPVIDSEFGLEEIDLAYQRSRSGHAVGKIVIAIK